MTTTTTPLENTLTKTNTNPPKKTKKNLVIRKSFRLFDFHVYDDAPNKEDSDSDHSSIEDNQFVIQMFGINENGETCCLYVRDYQPFFFVKVGPGWTEREEQALFKEIQKKLGRQLASCLLSAELVEYQKLYGFTGGAKDKFVKLTFQNSAVMNRVKNFWYEYNDTRDDPTADYRSYKPFYFFQTPLELYESNIPPLLRCFHIHNISPSGWISFQVNKVRKESHPSTTCTYEYICSIHELTPMPEKETAVPYKICSFDIEASSSHGDFPIPIKTYKRFAMNLVDVFLKQSHFVYQDRKNAEAIFKKVVYSAYGHDSFENVDLVYPKQETAPTRKSELIPIIKQLSTLSMEKIKAEQNADILRLLKIGSDSEKLKEFCELGGGGDGEEGEEAVEEESHTFWKGGAKRKPKIDKHSTLLDVLTSPDYDRDDKIQIANEILTTMLPALEGDKVTFIGSTFMRYGEPEPYLNHCVCLNGCDPVEGAVIETTESEKDLLLAWKELIQQENPDILIGYNIFGFDTEFLFRRAQETGCIDDFLKLSRCKGEICAKKSKDRTQPGEWIIENTKLKIASGEYDLRFFKMTGRLQIDMYAYFRRDFNLSSYKLDDVSCQFISDDIKRVVCTQHARHGPVTELYSQNLTGLHVGDYLHIEITGFTSDYYRDGHKFPVLAIEKGRVDETGKTWNVIVVEGHETELVDSSKGLKWGTAKDDVSPQDIFRLANGSDTDRAIVAKYCIQDCNLVHHLLNKIDVITGYVEMSRICSVPISFLVFRGQGIKLTSFVAKKCREKNTLMPDLQKPKEAEGYEGAIVLPPKCSMYMDNPVACVDYASLYPSGMISQNFSHDSKVWTREYDLDGVLVHEWGERNAAGEYVYDNLPGYTYIDMEFDTYKYLRKTKTSREEKTKVGRIVCRWAQLPDNQKSIMPSILEELLKARADTRKMIKTEKDPFMQNILDKRQLGYKVTANSLYGQCGSRTSTFYEKDVAAATTATGRMMITYAKRIIEEVYGNLEYDTEKHGTVLTKAEYVYGDTDSVFFTFNLEDPKTGKKIVGKDALEITIEIAQDVAHLCTKWLKPPMELTYEKTLMPFILLSKKRYVGMLYETDAKKGKMKFMGLSIKRRDSCDYLKDVYGAILNILMKDQNIQSAVDFLQTSLGQLVAGKVPIEKLMITKALRGYYKNPHQIGHRVLADRIGKRDPGNMPKPGDRMKFVFVRTANPKALMGDKIETPEFIKENKLPIDYTHYVTNQLMKPLQQLFGLALEQIWEKMSKQGEIKRFRAEVAKLEKESGDDLEVFMKKKEKLSSAKIKDILFTKILNKIHNQENRMQELTTYFKRV